MNITPAIIKSKLESAGRTLMMMPPVKGPKEYGTAWPEHLREHLDTLEVVDNSLVVINIEKKMPWPKPDSKQISELDQVLTWLTELAVYCNEKKVPWVIRTVWIAMLHHPITGKRLYSWRKIGKHLGKSQTTAQDWYEHGVSIISRLQNDAYLYQVIG